MRGMGIMAAVALSLPLGGCFSAILPPKELPDWAMSHSAPTRQRGPASKPSAA
jgi:hypothetical protein